MYINIAQYLDGIINNIPMICGSAHFSAIMYGVQQSLFSIKVTAERLDQFSSVTMGIQNPAVYKPIEEKEEYRWLLALITQLSDAVRDVPF